MRLHLAPIKSLLPAKAMRGRKGLLYQRLLWGALAGCLAAVLLGELPFLESLELNMLKWRYDVSNKVAALEHRPDLSRDISIVAFDDSSQYDLGVARFNDNRSQGVLAEALAVIEKGQPALVAIDLDLRGAANEDLIRLLRRYRNVVIALFGNLEGSSDLPPAEFMTHAAAYGYSELSREADGIVFRLPLNEQSIGDPKALSFAPVPSFTEAIMDAHQRVTGVGPVAGLLPNRADQPLYIDYRRTKYPVVPFEAVLAPGFDPSQLKGKVVLIGTTLTSRRDDPLRCRTPLDEAVPEVAVQADAVSTLLDDGPIFSFGKDIARCLLIIVGALFGACSSAFAPAMRTVLLSGGTVVLLVVSQLSFQLMHVAVPVVPSLAVLLTSFVLGTVIYLDTDLRQSNRELAEARLDMQERAEKERQRIAEDLHDETLPALSAVARMADKLSEDLTDNPVPLQMRQKLDNAVSEMRRVINDLHPSVLETMGFVPALENLTTYLMRENGIEAQFEDGTGKDDYNLSIFTQLQLYRIVQEALNNVGKHSKASQVQVKITKTDSSLLISVADDGRGFDPGSTKKDSHGLVNIRQRAQLIGAQVDWRKPKTFSSGTEVRIRIADQRNQS